MLDVVCEVIGKLILVVMVLCCVGDLSILVVVSDKVCIVLGWIFQYDDVKEIIKMVWIWKESYLVGYDDWGG